MTLTYTWHPSRDYLDHSNVARLMRTLSVATADELRARSVADIGAFWDTVVHDLGIEFRTSYSQVVDLTRGIEYPEWFTGGTINIVDAALGRWKEATPAATAIIHEAEAGTVRRLTFAELDDEVARVRAGLRARGIGKGDAVAIYLPMTPEAVVATYAVASIGAMVVPLFSGFAPAAIASRLQDADAKAVITADGTMRRRRTVPLKPLLDEALTACPGVEFVAVVDNAGEAVTLEPGRDVEWAELLAADPDPLVEPTSASDVLLLAYTSGTTGRPKGAVHTHAGFLVKVASEVAYGFEMAPGRTFCWITDMGWIMGPLSIFGAHACGGTLLLYEGSPDVPDTGLLGTSFERHRVSMLGVSPTLVRTVRAACRAWPATCRQSGCWDRRASRGTRSPTSGWPGTSSAAGFRWSTSPAAPRWAARSCAPTRWRRSTAAPWAVRRWAWTSTWSTTTAGRCAAASASSSAGSPGRR